MSFSEGKSRGDFQDLGGQNSNFPKIFRLIEAGASAQEIVQQIYTDFYSPDMDAERLFLGLQELLMRGSEGEAVLRFLSRDKGELGGVASRILEKQPMDDVALEKELGIDRQSYLLDINLDPNDPETFVPLYQRAVSLGVFKGDLGHFIDYMFQTVSTKNTGHFDNSIEKEIVCKSATFGQSEAAYLELLGPRKILETRAAKDPKFVLLGSLMQYSAREFAYYSKKLNKSALPLVLDLNPECVQRCSLYKGENDLDVKPGDALDMPIPDGTVDQIYTNHLFHYLISLNMGSVTKGKIENLEFLFKEVSRVLKPNGSFLVVEQSFGVFNTSGEEGTDNFLRTIQAYAIRAGLKVVKRSDVMYLTIFRPEILDINKGVPGVKIDENGFPHYEHMSVSSTKSARHATLRFEKI